MFFRKMVILGVKEFHGVHDDQNIIWKKLTPGRYAVQKSWQPKLNGVLVKLIVLWPRQQVEWNSRQL